MTLIKISEDGKTGESVNPFNKSILDTDRDDRLVETIINPEWQSFEANNPSYPLTEPGEPNSEVWAELLPMQRKSENDQWEKCEIAYNEYIVKSGYESKQMWQISKPKVETPEEKTLIENNIMKVEEIPADTLVVMTPELYQEFCIGGCVPACHLTREWIKMGDEFKLSTVPVAVHPTGSTGGYKELQTKEVMLSKNANVKDFIKKQQKEVSDYDKSKREAVAMGRGGCFRVNGKIIH